VYHKRQRSPSLQPLSATTNNTNNHLFMNTPSPMFGQTSMTMGNQRSTTKMPSLVLPEKQQPPMFTNVDLNQRQLKIRVVERMSELNTTIHTTISGSVGNNFSADNNQCNSPTSTNNATNTTSDTTEDVALLGIHDDELINASDEQLNFMSMQAAKQLVHALTQMADANEDDGLRQELWILDDNGFSFLHYICMYGYSSLLPVVLECIRRGNSGVNALNSAVNKPTKSGLYPLHLAVNSSSVEMVRHLMKAGATYQQQRW
jgi:hypothetical protein